MGPLVSVLTGSKRKKKKKEKIVKSKILVGPTVGGQTGKSSGMIRD